MLIEEQKAFGRLIFAILFSLAVLILLLTKKPFMHQEDQLLAAGAQFMLVVIFVGASFMKAFDDVRIQAAATSQPNIAAYVFGFESSDQIVNVIFSFAWLMLSSLLVTLAYTIILEGRLQTIRVRSTHKPPVLSLHVGERYHLFNSHIWSTGQCVERDSTRHRPLPPNMARGHTQLACAADWMCALTPAGTLSRRSSASCNG